MGSDSAFGERFYPTKEQAIAIAKDHIRVGYGMELTNGVPEALSILVEAAEQLTLNEYMVLAERTDKPTDQLNGLRNASMGMVGESAETLEHMKKVLDQGHKINEDKLIEEAGDTLWYIAKLARYCNVTLEELAIRNINKLRKRYPQGFDSEKSVNREG